MHTLPCRVGRVTVAALSAACGCAAIAGVVSNPGLLEKIGEAAAIAVNDNYKLQLTVSKPRG